MEEAQAKLIAEQLGRMQDMFKARLDAIEERLKHHTDLDQERTAAIRADLADLKSTVEKNDASVRKITDDHEQRLRSATDGVTTFKTWSGLASGGSSIMAIVAFIKSFIGG